MLFVVVVFPFLCSLQLLSQFLKVSLALFFYFLSSGFGNLHLGVSLRCQML